MGSGLAFLPFVRPDDAAACVKIGGVCRTNKGNVSRCCGGGKCGRKRCVCPRGKKKCGDRCVLNDATCPSQCQEPSDCPGSDNECGDRTCNGNQCGRNNRPAGSLTQNQTSGDCKREVCDGSGNIADQNDDTDAPAPGPCETTACENGVVTRTNLPAGSDCPDGVCNGSGACNSCVAGSACTTTFPGACAAGTIDCSTGEPICRPNVQPGQNPEVPGDGVDNHCDGVTT